MEIIKASHLYKEFKVYKRNKGFINTTKQLFKREYTIKKAVEDVSFSINKGEMVGYIGPNGAGKSTTIKMLTGILHPTSGEVYIRGIVPHKNRKENAMHIGVVFGQRSQLYWDLPMIDAFDLYKKMYKIDDKTFKENVAFFIDALDMEEFIERPVRQLSLGQKMRAEFSVALLHNPDILYLDEPTIGLDVLAKKKIRQSLKKVNEERDTTIILTTHDMDDIEEVCDRIILIDEGSLLYDGTIEQFKSIHSKTETIEFTYSEQLETIENSDTIDIKILDVKDGKKIALYDTKKYKSYEVLKMLMEQYMITDISIKDNNLEEVIREIYESK